MRITFTDEELDELLDILRYMTDPCSDNDVARHRRIVKKLERARSTSWASRAFHKKTAIDEETRRRRNQLLNEHSERILRLYARA